MLTKTAGCGAASRRGAGLATATGSVTGLFNVGADVPVKYSFNSDHSSLTGQNLESNDVALLYTVTGVGSGTELLTAKAGLTTVFTLSLDENTGAYTFTLLSHIDHRIRAMTRRRRR